MKPVLYGLLGVSLAGNVALLALTRAPAPESSLASIRPTTATIETTVPAVRAPGPAPSLAVTPMRWVPVTNMDSLHATAAAMRAAGFPARTTWAVVDRLFMAQLDARSPFRGLPYWQTPTAAQRQAAKDSSVENLRLRTELKAAIGRPSELLDPLDRERLFGNLSDEKVDALYSLTEDYEKIRAKLHAGLGTPRPASGVNDAIQQMFALQGEQQSDVASLLTPEELQIYEMRQSASARRVAEGAQALGISDDEFVALYRLDKQFVGEDLPGIDPRAHAQRQKREADQPEYYAQLQATLGEERFYTYLTGLDSNYRSIRQLAGKYPTLTPQLSYQVLQLSADVRRQIAAFQRDGARGDFVAMFVTVHARLEALVGREAAAAVRQSAVGGIFNGPTR